MMRQLVDSSMDFRSVTRTYRFYPVIVSLLIDNKETVLI